MFLREARLKCKPAIEDFVNCSRREGLLVVIRCRKENRKQNECVKQYTTEENWQEYRQRKVQEYIDQGLVEPLELQEKKRR